MKLMQRLLREPLVHFIALGGLIFLLYAAVSGPRPAPVNTIVIGPERIEQLKQGYQAVWRRAPNADELKAIIDDFVREEVYYREAMTLGLDRNDTVVRRRLRQKMEFLTDSGADLVEPSAEEMEAYVAANAKSFRKEPRIAFEQIFFGRSPSAEQVAGALKTLQSDPTADPSTLGERTLLPARLALSPPEAVDGLFGEGFFNRLASFQTGVWSGPVASGHGVHLVRILNSRPASMPPLADIREAVLRDWRATKARELREQHYARLRQRYTVEILGAESATKGSR